MDSHSVCGYSVGPLVHRLLIPMYGPVVAQTLVRLANIPESYIGGMSKANSPKLAQAKAWLSGRPVAPRTARRESIDTLARKAGVSRVTMWKALQQTGTGSTPRPQQVRDALLQDILSGLYPRGSRLPVAKELCERYGTGTNTLVSALSTLVHDRFLVRHRRGYAVFDLDATRPARQQVLCVTLMSSRARFSRSTPWSAEFWRTVEQQCTRRGLRFDVRSAWDLRETAESSDIPPYSLNELLSGGQVLGVMYWALGSGQTQMRRVLAAASSFGIPVGVIYEAATDGLQGAVAEASLYPKARVFALATGDRCGEDVGRFLMARGHRGVAFFGSGDLMRRADGVDRVYESAGMREALKRFAASPFPYGDTSSGKPGRQFRSALQRMQSVARGLGSEQSDTVDMYQPDGRLVEAAFLRDSLTPLFEQAWSDSTLTAWVGANDMTAFLALDYLSMRQGARRVAVVGFDDSVDAFDRGLTSYNFGAAPCAVSLIDHLIAPTARPSLHPQVLVEMPGSVVERDSTLGRQ